MPAHRRLLGVLLAASILLAACSDSRERAGADEGEDRTILQPDPSRHEVGRLAPFVADRSFDPEVVGSSSVPPVQLDLTALENMVVAPDGALWGLIPVPPSSSGTGMSAVLLKVSGDRAETIELPADVKPDRGMAVGPDDTAYVISDDGELLRLHDGQVTPTGQGGAGDLFRPAAAPDGTVYVADRGNRQIVAIAPDGSARAVVTGIDAGSMAVGPDGTLYYYDSVTGIRAISPSGQVRDIGGLGDEEPRDGAPAVAADFVPAGMAVNDDGLHVLFTNQVWRIDEDGRLRLLLRRRWHRTPPEGPDDNEVKLYEIAAGGDDVYVWDRASDGVIYRVEPAE